MPIRYILSFLFLFAVANGVFAQDPHFTQNGTASALINPAYTGVFNGNLRIGSNYRQQWSSIGSPFTTMLLSVDGKLSQSETLAQSPFCAGVVVQADKTLKGALTSTNFSFNTAYHVPLNSSGDKTLGLGLMATYGKSSFNFNQLASGSQFTSGGFNLALPSGEAFFENMRPYLSLGAGLLFVNSNPEEGTFFEIGASAYHLNRPQLNTLYEGDNEIPMRFCAQATLQRYLAENLLMDLRLLYQNQSASDYLLGSISLAKLLSEDQNGSLVGLGLSYRSGDALAPNFFTEFNSFRFGFSYDFQMSGLTKNNIPVSTMELSLQYRIKSK
jgi:type IX secretion system PorP/SprF family membrane protein